MGSYSRHGDQTGTNRNEEETARSNGNTARLELDCGAGHPQPLGITVRENSLS